VVNVRLGEGDMQRIIQIFDLFQAEWQDTAGMAFQAESQVWHDNYDYGKKDVAKQGHRDY
jgi:hypothetical protein